MNLQFKTNSVNFFKRLSKYELNSFFNAFFMVLFIKCSCWYTYFFTPPGYFYKYINFLLKVITGPINIFSCTFLMSYKSTVSGLRIG